MDAAAPLRAHVRATCALIPPSFRAADARAHTHGHRAHSRAEPYLEIFELLLSHGADATLLTYEGWEDVRAGRVGVPQSVFDVATDAGLGWKPGRLRRLLKALVAKHAAVPKAKAFRCARARGHAHAQCARAAR